MSHPMNDELKERLYEDALEEVGDAFPKVSEEIQDEIAILVAKDRWHSIDSEESCYVPAISRTPRTHYNTSKIDELFKWLYKSPFIYEYKIEMNNKITITFDPRKGGEHE